MTHQERISFSDHIESTNLTKSLVCTFFVLFHTATNLGIDFIAFIAAAHLIQNCSSIIPLLYKRKKNSYKSCKLKCYKTDYDEDKDQLEEENTKKGREDHGLYNKPGLLISFTIILLYFIDLVCPGSICNILVILHIQDVGFRRLEYLRNGC